MSVIVCPPASAPTLNPDWPVPHPGFGLMWLFRNGREVWSDLDGAWWDDTEPWTVGQLTGWCPVSQGIGWKLVVDGPMVKETYRLRKGGWQLTERANGFA